MTTAYDYDKQAWIQDGIYVTCGHPNTCDCYGKAHAGEIADYDGDNDDETDMRTRGGNAS